MNQSRHTYQPWSAVLAATLLCSLSSAAIGAESVTLLVHGIKVDLAAAVDVWGRLESKPDGTLAWTGMIGHLEQAGHRFGGVIRLRGAKLELPDGLDRQATLFALEFSDGANVDGLAYKTLELAACLAELRRFTGCRKVNILAHSAGGLVARAYIQMRLPGIRYAGDVDRLITISTPHLGSALAEHLGDFLGTRATALKPGGELIRRLNDELELPPDVLLASIVVRGVGTGIAALDFPSSAYEPHLDREVLASLPLDYRRGGDQVVDVRSQNLRLARTASRYEAATGRPVLYLLARVADPSPADRSLAERSVHEAAPSDPWTCLWAELLLDRHRRCWSPLDGAVEEPLDRAAGLSVALSGSSRSARPSGIVSPKYSRRKSISLRSSNSAIRSSNSTLPAAGIPGPSCSPPPRRPRPSPGSWSCASTASAASPASATPWPKPATAVYNRQRASYLKSSKLASSYPRCQDCMPRINQHLARLVSAPRSASDGLLLARIFVRLSAFTSRQNCS